MRKNRNSYASKVAKMGSFNDILKTNAQKTQTT